MLTTTLISGFHAMVEKTFNEILKKYTLDAKNVLSSPTTCFNAFVHIILLVSPAHFMRFYKNLSGINLKNRCNCLIHYYLKLFFLVATHEKVAYKTNTK